MGPIIETVVSQAGTPPVDGLAVAATATLNQPDVELRLNRLASWPCVRWETVFNSGTPLKKDTRVQLHLACNHKILRIGFPSFDGTFEWRKPDSLQGGYFPSAGSCGIEFPKIPRINRLHGIEDIYRIAIPMMIMETDRGLYMLGCDPEFSATFLFVPQNEKTAEIRIVWQYSAQAGVHSDEKRAFFLKPFPCLSDAINGWFDLALPDVPKGPDWIHEVALQNFDYFSKNGNGWYNDIDAFTRMSRHEDRHKAVFTLHGWYDLIGRYCYDEQKKKLDEEWTVFPLIHHPFLLERSSRSKIEPHIMGVPFPNKFRSLQDYNPVKMNWEGLRNRLRYAKDRGIRTCLYTFTGMESPGDRRKAVETGIGLNLDNPVWKGPDLVGETFVRNPLHPGNVEFFITVLQALLEQLGDLLDLLIMDEMYYVEYGCMGPKACPGYADRALMRLTKKLAETAHQFRPDMALMCNDLIGLPDNRAFPYGMFCDGAYQDTSMFHLAWHRNRFTQWRNTVWSCNWWPVTNIEWTKHGVLSHGAPVALSNGCLGDDTGLGDMEENSTPYRIIQALWDYDRQNRRTNILPETEVRFNMDFLARDL
jgi:hypothetical protein